MVTMNISLTPELAKSVKAKVKSGKYGNASEVIRDAIRRMDAEAEAYKYRIERLREALAPGLKDLKEGRYTEYSSVEEFIKDMEGDES